MHCFKDICDDTRPFPRCLLTNKQGSDFYLAEVQLIPVQCNDLLGLKGFTGTIINSP